MEPDLDLRNAVWTEIQEQIAALQVAMAASGVNLIEGCSDIGNVDTYGSVDMFDDGGEMLPDNANIGEMPSPVTLQFGSDNQSGEHLARLDWLDDVPVQIAASRILDNMTAFIMTTAGRDADLSEVNLSIPADGELKVSVTRKIQNDWFPEDAGLEPEAVSAPTP